jgi:predicted phage tail protein
MREVRLYGHLAKKFGKVFTLDVASPAEAVRALCANFQGFDAAMAGHKPGYRVFVGRGDIGMDDLAFQSGTAPIKIVPVVAGAKNGLGQVLVGVLIIVAAFYTGGASLSASGAVVAGTTGTMALSFGVSMVVGGLSQMLMSAPSTASPKEAPGSEPSYAFNGPVNTTAQGNPVPVGYGRMIVGSQVVSAGMSVEQRFVAPVRSASTSPYTGRGHYGQVDL